MYNIEKIEQKKEKSWTDYIAKNNNSKLHLVWSKFYDNAKNINFLTEKLKTDYKYDKIKKQHIYKKLLIPDNLINRHNLDDELINSIKVYWVQHDMLRDTEGLSMIIYKGMKPKINKKVLKEYSQYNKKKAVNYA